ncbi:MAG: hypothetical protein H7174_03240, partial [Flavobacterium sp.]|nr:hypothetical protein [Flavobacterium sp.]
MKKIIILFLLFFAQLNFSQELLMEFEVITSPDENSPKFEGGSVLKFYEFIKKEFNLNKITKAGTITTS